MKYSRHLLITVMILFNYLQSFSQDVIEDTTEYQSGFDKSLTLHKVTYLPTSDNVNGIYAKDVDKKLADLISSNHQWNFVPAHIAGSSVKPEEFVTNPKKVKEFSQHLNADGFLVADIRKDPDDITVHLYLFSSLSGKLITEDSLKRPTDNTSLILQSVEQLYMNIKEKIPYDALIVSRVDNRITINAGNKDGVHVGQNLTAVKIISAETHPKRNFIIKSNKALLGQIRIVKADDYLSFADIVSESEPGVLTKGVKITGISQIKYKETPWTNTYTPPEQLLSENNYSVFGKEAHEWIAKDPPTFGRIGAQFSLGSFDNSLGLSDGTNLNSKVTTYPKIDLSGEVWITPKIYADANFSQGIGQSSDPTSGGDVSNSLTQYRLSFGYNFILRNEFFGPKLTFDLGFSGYQMFVDTNSNNGFTTLQYRSIPIGIGGYVPINETQSWAIGGKAYFHMFPRLTERPFSSGSSADSNINQFIFYAENKISQRLRLKFGMEFLMLSTSFSGGGDRPTPARSLSHRFTLLSTGIHYLF
jgi:hypothetical protein